MTAVERLRLGVIGCGEVAQAIHLPTLRELEHLFEVTALYDMSASVLEAVGAHWSGARRFADHRQLLAYGGVDAVLIANHSVDHAVTTLDAIAAGKHVLVEKPMCLNLHEADRLIAAAETARCTVQVGFMRRYAPAFIEAVARVAAWSKSITLARVHDLIGMNALLIGSLGAQLARRTDMPPSIAERTRARMSAAIELAIGSVLPDRANAYQLLLALGSHDLSAMRELLGPPRSILYARQDHGGRIITAALDYGTYVCQLELGVDTLPRYETYLQVHSESEVIRVDYDTPYIRHLPAKLQITNLHGGAGIAHLTSFPSRRDAFSLQWQAFYENVRQHRQPKTSLADGRQDLVLARDLLGQMT